MMVRYCTECEEEFQPHVLVCSDCGAPLSEPLPEGTRPPPPAAPSLAQVLAGDPVYAAQNLTPEDGRQAARVLAEAGLAFRIQVSSRRLSAVDVIVGGEDQAAAIERLTAAGLVAPIDARDPVALQGGPCPACGATVVAGAYECPDCGLGLQSEPTACPRCGLARDEPWLPCPQCAEN